MAIIDDLLNVDLDKIRSAPLKKAVESLVWEYKQEKNKALFVKEAGENIAKILQMVKKHAPEAISKGTTKKVPAKPSASKGSSSGKSGKAEKKQAKKEPDPEEDETDSQKIIEELKALEPELEACRATIRDYNKRKREMEGPKPKKTRHTRLKEKLLSLVQLIPDNLKDNVQVQQKTEKILLTAHRELIAAWGMDKIKAKPGEDAIKEKFNQMEEKQDKSDKKKPRSTAFSKPSPKKIALKKLKVELLYRDSGNYKTFFDHEIDLETYPKAKELKVGSEFTMGEYGTPNQEKFFNSDIYPNPYDPDEDHDILEVTEISGE